VTVPAKARKATETAQSSPQTAQQDQAGTTTPAAAVEPSETPTAATYDLVRVKDPISGHEFSVSQVFAEAQGLPILDKPATDEFGAALPAKHNINKGAAPASEESA
jgi:hypothetical protein